MYGDLVNKLYSESGFDQEKVAAANLINAIQTGQLDLNQLTDDELVKVAQVVQAASEEMEKTAEEQALAEWLQIQDLAGRIQARAFDDELHKLAYARQHYAKPLSAEEKLASAAIKRAIETGQLDPNQLSPQEIEKIAELWEREKLAADTDTPPGPSTPPPESGGGGGGKGGEAAKEEAKGILNWLKTKIHEPISGFGAKLVPGKLEEAESFLGKHPWMAPAAGYGSLGALAALLGLGTYYGGRAAGWWGNKGQEEGGMPPEAAMAMGKMGSAFGYVSPQEKVAAYKLASAFGSGAVHPAMLSEYERDQAANLLVKVAAEEGADPGTLKKIWDFIAGIPGKIRGGAQWLGGKLTPSAWTGAPYTEEMLKRMKGDELTKLLGTAGLTEAEASLPLSQIAKVLGEKGVQVPGTHPGLAEAIGWGAGLAGLGGLGAGGYYGGKALGLWGKGQPEEAAGAAPEMALAASPYNMNIALPAGQYHPGYDQNGFEQEAIKTAQAILTANGINVGSPYDPNAIRNRAMQILQQQGWNVM